MSSKSCLLYVRGWPRLRSGLSGVGNAIIPSLLSLCNRWTWFSIRYGFRWSQNSCMKALRLAGPPSASGKLKYSLKTSSTIPSHNRSNSLCEAPSSLPPSNFSRWASQRYRILAMMSFPARLSSLSVSFERRWASSLLMKSDLYLRSNRFAALLREST